MSVRPENVLAGHCDPLSVPDLIRRSHVSLLNVLRRRMRASEDAADVAQEAYIRMLQFEGSRNIQSPYSMLVRIAINVANDMGRSAHARRAANQCSIDDVELPSGHPTPERELSASQDLDTLCEAISQLPPRCQQVFLLSRAQHMTYPQIAVHCGISVKMVEKHVSHALAFCMKRVGFEGGSVS